MFGITCFLLILITLPFWGLFLQIKFWQNHADLIEDYRITKSDYGKPLKTFRDVAMKNQNLSAVNNFRYANVTLDLYSNNFLVSFWGRCRTFDYNELSFTPSFWYVYMYTGSSTYFVISKKQYNIIKNIMNNKESING